MAARSRGLGCCWILLDVWPLYYPTPPGLEAKEEEKEVEEEEEEEEEEEKELLRAAADGTFFFLVHFFLNSRNALRPSSSGERTEFVFTEFPIVLQRLTPLNVTSRRYFRNRFVIQL